MMDQAYVDSVRLLLESVPVIFETPHFAMKGGTAINLFVLPMPRLSVDVDMARRFSFLPDRVRFAIGWHLGITLGVCMSGLRPNWQPPNFCLV